MIFEILEKIIGTFEEGCQSSAHFSLSLFNSLLKPRLRHCFQALLSFIPSLIGVLFKSCCVLNYTIFFALVMEKLNLLRKELQTMTYSGLISGDYKSCSFSFLSRTFFLELSECLNYRVTDVKTTFCNYFPSLKCCLRPTLNYKSNMQPDLLYKYIDVVEV